MLGLGILKYTNFSVPCIFKHFLHIPCPGCGLTRAFREILKLNFIKAFSYNYLSIIILIVLIILNIAMVIDIIKDKNITNKIINKITKYSYIIIILLIISEIINLYSK